MFRLIKNEFIKIWGQTGYKVLLIIIAALMVIAPIASFFYEKIINESYNSDSYYVEWAEQYKGAEDWYGKLEYADYEVSLEVEKFYTDRNLPTDGWLYSCYAEDYSDLLYSKIVHEYLRDNLHNSELMQAIEEGSAYRPVYYSDPKAPYHNIHDDIISYDYTKDYPDNIVYNAEEDIVSVEDLEVYIESLETQIAEMETTIASNDPAIYLNTIRDNCDSLCLEASKEKEEAEKTYKQIPTDANQYAIDCATRRLDEYEFYLWMADWMLEHDLTPDDWQYTVMNSLYNSVMMDGTNGVTQPESLRDQYYSQEDVDAADQRYQSMKEIIRRSFVNDTPLTGIGEEVTKTEFNGHISFIVGLLTIFCIVMAAQMVAQEYATGTIRLLLIRPRSRNKIMTSKILCMCLMIAGLLLLSVIVMLPLDLALFGVGDIFDPDYIVTGGSVATVPHVLTVLKNLAFDYVSIIGFGALALLISTLIRRSALAIVLSIIVEISATAAQSIIFALSELSMYGVSFKWIRFTVLPYLDLSVFGDTLVDYYASQISWNTCYYEYYNVFDPTLGLGIVLAHIALLLFFIYLAFRKKQVKN